MGQKSKKPNPRWGNVGVAVDLIKGVTMYVYAVDKSRYE